MKTDPGQRAYQLIEELRAEVDFEIDDVIAQIVRNLPEEYFVTLSRKDQIVHLKSLLAISICQLSDWLTLRSDNGRQIAVVARQNYSGMLAKIIASLPHDQALIGAKIFTSTNHDFIIDLFEFAPSDDSQVTQQISSLELSDLIENVSQLTSTPAEKVKQFIDLYPRQTESLKSGSEIADHFRAYQMVRAENSNIVFWRPSTNTRVTIASPELNARDLFQLAAQALSDLHADIDQAFLYDFPLDDGTTHVAVASFLATGDFTQEPREYENYLTEYMAIGS